MIYEKENTKNISFPLGGIGTGSFGLTGYGGFRDWEIFNKPSKNSYYGYTHFLVKAKTHDKTTVKVLQGDFFGQLGLGTGPQLNTLAGFPHFKNVTFDTTYPHATLTFTDSDFPGIIKLSAFNPIIPHDDKNSSLPCAFFECEFVNNSNQEIEYGLAFSMHNKSPLSKNTEVDSGIIFTNTEKTTKEIGYYDLCVLTDANDYACQEYWYRGTWNDDITTFINNFTSQDRLCKRHYDNAGQYDHGSVASYITLKPNEAKKVRFVFAWNVPNQYNYWHECKDENGNHVIWKNYYATLFSSSYETARYALDNFSSLQEKSLKFITALKNSSLPPYAIDAIASNLSTLKSPTVLRLEDGSIWGWEGVNNETGSCQGSCQHVWNYAYALCFLFPNLERSLRETNFEYGIVKGGGTMFRIPLPLGRKLSEPTTRPCLDGQMGEIIKTYREWKISGDDDWLKKYFPYVKSMLEFAWSEENCDRWDYNKDGVLEGRQHHTLDVELFGPSSWLQGMYLLALDCASKMALYLGETDKAKEYKEIYNKGKKWTNENLFNGEYYCQEIDLSDKDLVASFDALNKYWNDEVKEIKYQIKDGCEIDQMLADWHANILGLDCIFDDDKKKKSLDSLYKYNHYKKMRNLQNIWRIFALNDESGTIICSYPPTIKRHNIPIPYYQECMTGFEYSLAGLMISEGKIKKGETLIKAVRDRFNGKNRNPFNEIECGNNYARAMSSYALLPIYSGFKFDMVNNHIGFSPLTKNNCSFMWSVKNSWGEVEFKDNLCVFKVYGEPITLQSFEIKKGNQIKSVVIDGNQSTFTQNGNVINFVKTAIKNEIIIKTC